MALPLRNLRPAEIVYPESDGKPMADNSIQLRWIIVLVNNLTALFAERLDVWVGGNLMWYPVEGEPEIKNAPDVLVVFGRPKRERGSYRQWEEDNVPLTVVFEIQSPGNSTAEMDDKLTFYDEYGVEEYYLYNPETNRLKVFLRHGEVLRRIRPSHNFTSPRLGVRFDLSGPEMVVYRPSGERFLTFEELEAARNAVVKRADAADKRAVRLCELFDKLLQGQATPAETQELEQLRRELTPPPR